MGSKLGYTGQCMIYFHDRPEFFPIVKLLPSYLPMIDLRRRLQSLVPTGDATGKPFHITGFRAP
jgi:hypothetical protein